ncbi:MAG: hypothetical protein EOM12_09565 [Verrucomicrobiae bacterium]|nr:hypothetical protein [Verrucomicrobiae bacterium]
MQGGDGDDWFDGHGEGNDWFDGGNGRDVVSYLFTFSGSVSVNLALGTASGEWIGTDTLTGIEDIVGTRSDDTLIGDDGDNCLDGCEGDGNDWLDGGAGFDCVSYAYAPGPISVNLALGTAVGTLAGAGIGTDTLISIESITGGNYDDTLIGDNSDNWLYGGDGYNTLTGGLGADTFVPYVWSSGAAIITDFAVGNGGDILNIRETLFNYTNGDNPFTLGHLRLTQSGANTLLEAIGGDGFFTAAILNNVTASTLVAYNLDGYEQPSGIASTLSLSETNTSAMEGNSGQTSFTFTVIREGDTYASASVSWSVSGSGANPATAADFNGGVLSSGTLTFAAGETSKNITVDVAGDTTAEYNETFTLALSNPNGATLDASSVTGTILNDDATTNHFSKDSNYVVLQPSSPAIVGAGAGDDTYLISGSMLQYEINLTISDTIGKNSIQLAEGLSISSSQVTTTALKLTLSTGASVTIIGADAFTYDVGGNTTAGIDNIDVNFTSFAENTLGTSIPTSGVATGEAVVIGDVAEFMQLLGVNDLNSEISIG